MTAYGTTGSTRRAELRPCSALGPIASARGHHERVRLQPIIRRSRCVDAALSAIRLEPARCAGAIRQPGHRYSNPRLLGAVVASGGGDMVEAGNSQHPPHRARRRGQHRDWRQELRLGAERHLCGAEFLWRRHRNRGNADAVLYLCSDMPLLEKIGQYRAQGRAPNGKLIHLVM